MLVQVFDPAILVSLIVDRKVTSLLGVPTMFVAILEHLEENPADVSSLEVASAGGSMVSPDLVRKINAVLGCPFETVYGQTESSPLVTQHYRDDTIEDICTSIGQPLPCKEVAIRDPASNTVVPVDIIGEICVRGYCNMIAYYKKEEATAEAIDQDDWLHTGDLGAMDSRGYLRITGRVKEMIIRGGENHFPAEIENILLEHPSISEVAIVGLPDEKWGEIIACFAKAEGNQIMSRQELHAHCRKHLSAQKTPTVWCQVYEFPLTGSGKIQKFALRDGYADGLYQAID